MKRLAIVGTAETWKDAPFEDTSWTIATLNDAYQLGVPRADLWYDIHNPAEWILVPEGQKVVKAWEVPPGQFYPRPAKHLTFLAHLTIPAYVYQARPDWATSRTFPREAIERRYGRYMASTPAWILAHALLPEPEGGLGYEAGDEVGLWGIHLATEREYVEQRPNMEWLIGLAEGKGLTVTIPKDCPLRQHRWIYGYEHRPDAEIGAISREIHAAAREEQAIATWLQGPRDTPLTLARPAPTWVGSDPHERLLYIQAVKLEAEGRLNAVKLRAQGMAV